MAAVASAECRVDITSDRQNGCSESKNRRLLRKVGLNIKEVVMAWCRKILDVGVEDPRRIIHAMKVGLALSVVSLVCLWDPLFRGVGVGDNAIWAVMTVVVVLEFSAGATMSKGLNRGIGTVVAGSLAFLVCYLSEQVAQGEAVVVGSSLFIIGAASTYARFFPFIKIRFDYGVVIFLLTFSMITVSGYRVQNILRMAYERLTTILIGCGVCVVVSLLLFPIWAGEDLHNSTVRKLQGLMESLEGCVDEYFSGRHEDKVEDESEDPIYQGYKSVLDSKATDDSLATFASWEPRHGRFRFRHPWKQYVKIGVKLRYLAYSIVALHGCLRSEIETPHSLRSVLKKPCTKVGQEAAKLLGELSSSIQQMRRCDWESIMKELQLAVKDLHAALHAQPKLLLHSTRVVPMEKIVENESREAQDNETGRKGIRRLMSWHGESGSTETEKRLISGHGVEFAEALPLATFAWTLVEIVARLKHVAEAVEELATMANFKPYNPSSKQEAQNITSHPSSNYTPRPSFGRTPEIYISSNIAD
ncbi:aluminum-activated malate transporter 12 [Cryptomeria japonica]|uniref:aluminum-activated malate transporter 12 n=1 Tax=Cryptomeria japonica TaxID=3369 RepID=UPI0027DA293F|nr:aluminum-activated malate transporter 12 [Cryptomeria japonica]